MRLSALETGDEIGSEIGNEIGNKIGQARYNTMTNRSPYRTTPIPFVAIVQARNFGFCSFLSQLANSFSRLLSVNFALLSLFDNPDRCRHVSSRCWFEKSKTRARKRDWIKTMLRSLLMRAIGQLAAFSQQKSSMSSLARSDETKSCYCGKTENENLGKRILPQKFKSESWCENIN